MDFSQKEYVFHDFHLPEQGMQLAGYSALINSYKLHAPLPIILSAISKKNKKYELDNWIVFPAKYVPNNSLNGHLVFALKYEGVDLSVLKALFSTICHEEITKMITKQPTSSYNRRIWFLYEWLLDTKLDLPDLAKQNLVNVLDPKLQYPGPTRTSRRHRVRNNLPGTRKFCPTIRRTKTLDKFINLDLSQQVLINTKKINPTIISRAAAFLLLKDSKASYAIEGETPPQNRAERWGRAIGQAGLHPLSDQEFYRLQNIVIENFRFINPGYRIAGGFIGIHDRATSMPIPDHISARHEDVTSLMHGLMQTNELLKSSEFDPVLIATIISFGFVFIHPLEDGNGRIHRYLLHHVLAENKFAPKGIIFPISAAILENIDNYKKVLETYSQPRLKFIEWHPTLEGNVKIKNDTIDLYRYYDMTLPAEFLYECIERTIKEILPAEIKYLQQYDAMHDFINNYIDMPDRMINLLIIFLQQNDGKLSSKAKQKEFIDLTKEEISVLEQKYSEIF